MNLLHQCLQRAPTDFAKISVVVLHELLAVAGAVDADVRPRQIVVRFSQAAIANERRFRSHGPVLAFRAGYDGRWPDRYNGKSRTPGAILRPTARRPDAPTRRA
jgi:hypothetical protein